MQTKFEVGDAVWFYSAYDNGESFDFWQGKIIGIDVDENVAIYYKVRVDGHYGDFDCRESRLGYTKNEVIQGAMRYIDDRIITLETEKEYLRDKLED